MCSILLATFLIVTTSITVNYTLVAPGFNNNIEDIIIIEDGMDEKGSFSTTSVIVLYKMPLLQKWFAENIKTVRVSKSPTYYTQTTTKALNYRSLMMKDDSLAKSIIVAYEKASIDIDYETKYKVSLVFDFLEEDTLQLGDEILSLNGYEFQNFPPTQCGDTVEVHLKRDGELQTVTLLVKEIDDICRVGFSVGSATTITSSDKEFTFIDTNTGGPSGGLMQSLYVFNELTEKDYTNGLQIAGTGTINLDGSVGPIGGIQQKIITSVLNGIDIFFCPAGNNCDDAQETLDTLRTDMILVRVATMDEAIAYLEGYGDDHE